MSVTTRLELETMEFSTLLLPYWQYSLLYRLMCMFTSYCLPLILALLSSLYRAHTRKIGCYLHYEYCVEPRIKSRREIQYLGTYRRTQLLTIHICFPTKDVVSILHDYIRSWDISSEKWKMKSRALQPTPVHCPLTFSAVSTTLILASSYVRAKSTAQMIYTHSHYSGLNAAYCLHLFSTAKASRSHHGSKLFHTNSMEEKHPNPPVYIFRRGPKRNCA